jgi:hypothetical protein
MKRAPTDHIVYFLLTSYVHARACADRRGRIPNVVKRFPIAGVADIEQRVEVLRHLADHGKAAHRLVSEVLDVFNAAAAKLGRSARAAPADVTTRKRVFG